MPSGRLEGRKVLLVGVSKGLGAATASYLLAEGALVAISARDQKLLDGISLTLSNPKRLYKVKGDASTPEGARKLVKSAYDSMKGINDLAVLVGGFVADRIEGLEALESMTLNHIKIPLYVVNAALQSLKKGSSIVLVSSSMAMHKAHGPLSYSIGKIGTAKEVELLANQLMENGIRVNGIAPLAIDGDFRPDTEFKSTRKLGDGSAPPDAFAKVIVWLMTQESQWVNGVVIPVDGGARLKS
ncbi:MAG: SDR family oxidoreductase [Candidatus Micrarchaeota archaeon]|nr:SDR family oxidoreductase [Candidatus Micrarchaeota archaeon]